MSEWLFEPSFSGKKDALIIFTGCLLLIPCSVAIKDILGTGIVVGFLRNWLIISSRFWGGYYFRRQGAANEHSRGYVIEPQRSRREKDPAKIGKLLSTGS